MAKNILVLIHSEFEEIEAITPIDLFRRAGYHVTTASTSNEIKICGKSSILIKADCLLKDLIHDKYDAIVIPGGPGVFKIRNQKSIQELIKKFHNQKKLIGCICAAPLLLLDIGLNDRFSMTCHPSVSKEFKNLIPNKTVKNGHIITSKGAGTSIHFSLTIIKTLSGKMLAKRVAEAICFNF